MKIFAYFVLGFMLVALFGLFFNSGISARNDKYIKEVVLTEKGENTLENNKDPLFVERLFSLKDFMYNKTIVGTIVYSKTVIIDNQSVDIDINIDIYQTMPLMFDDKIKYYFHGIVNEFKSSLETTPYLTIIGYYENNITASSNEAAYVVKDLDFPIFGLNNTVTSNKLNKLNTAVFTYKNVELFELVLNEANGLETQFVLSEFENYPSDLNHFYDTVTKTLTVRSGGFLKPTKEQLLTLNESNYNYHIFEGQDQYNYLIWIYMGIYVVIVGVIISAIFIRKRIKKNA
ncbi:MAG: hypothetical protein ACOX56_00105 [Acholeplasmataceae bacterium]